MSHHYIALGLQLVGAPLSDLSMTRVSGENGNGVLNQTLYSFISTTEYIYKPCIKTQLF